MLDKSESGHLILPQNACVRKVFSESNPSLNNVDSCKEFWGEPYGDKTTDEHQEIVNHFNEQCIG